MPSQTIAHDQAAATATAHTLRPCAMFPGQGSQHGGMGRDLYRVCPEVRTSIDAASQQLGRDLAALLSTGTDEELAKTDVAQVAVFALSTGLWEHLTDRGAQARMVMGHSAGEYAALVAAGMLDRDDAMSLVVARGRAMAEACDGRPGGMAAIGGLPGERVEAICAEVSATGRGVVVVANHNAHIQTVVSGDVAAVDAAAALARQRGAPRVVRLSVGGAFHSPLMATARDRLEPLLQTAAMHQPRTIMVSSITGSVVDDVEAYRRQLVEQIVSPVQWMQALSTARRYGGSLFVEVGPGRVLTGLVKSYSRQAAVANVNDVPSCTRLASLLQSVAVTAAAKETPA